METIVRHVEQIRSTAKDLFETSASKHEGAADGMEAILKLCTPRIFFGDQKL